MDTFLKRVIWLIIIAPSIYLAIVWNTIPDIVPLHVNLKGVVDRYGSKNELIAMTLILTAVNVLVYLLLPQVYRIDPKRYAAENKSRLHRIAFAVYVSNFFKTTIAVSTAFCNKMSIVKLRCSLPLQQYGSPLSSCS